MKRASFCMILLALAATASASDSIRVYEKKVSDMPLPEARFAANVKKGQAWIEVDITREAPERVYVDSDGHMHNSRDEMEMVTTVTRAPMMFSLDSAGSIIMDDRGVPVVCAQVKQKHFLFIPYKKVVETGHCKLNAFTNVEDGQATVIVDLIVK